MAFNDNDKITVDELCLDIKNAINKIVSGDLERKINNHINTSNIHITNTERNTWNNKSDFSGNYNDLVDAPDILDNGEKLYKFEL